MKPDLCVGGLLWLHPCHRPALRKIGMFLLLLAFIQLLAWLASGQFDKTGIPGYLPLHTLFETTSIVISMMVFSVGWNARSKTLPGHTVLLACLFFAVGWLDFSHTISYKGMPEFYTPNDGEKQLYFWLSARFLASIALLLAVIRPWLKLSSTRSRYLLMGGMISVTLLVHWLVLFHQDDLPHVFIPDLGLTPLKKDLEYLFITINIATALLLWRKMRQPQPFNAAMLFGAVCVMGMGEFFFTLYTNLLGSYNVLGHIYKVISYLFIYRAIIVETVEQPYQELSASQERMEATLNALPDLMFEVDEKGVIRGFHSAVPELLAVPPEVFVNKTIRESLPQESAEVIMGAISDAGKTGRSHGKQYQLQLPQGQKKWYELSVARKTGRMEGERSFVMLARDITRLKDNEAVLQMQAQRAVALLDLPRIAAKMDEKSFMQRAQEIAENLTGSEISFIHFVNNGGEEIELVAWSRRTLEEYCTAAYDSHYPVSKAGIWADALREGKPVVFNDYASYPHKYGLPQGHSPLQRLISVPVIENGKVVMLTGVGNKNTDYTDLDIETVQLISHEIWHIVQRTRVQIKLTRLSKVVERSQNEIYLLDPQTWLFIDANQGALDKIGYSLQELRQMTPLDLKPELSKESYAAFLAQVLSAEQENVRFVAQHRRKDGTLYPVEIHLEKTHDEPPMLMQIALDITERNVTEVQLHKQLDELHRWQKAMTGREDRIIGVKQEVNELLAQLGQPPRYADQLPAEAGGGAHEPAKKP